MYGPTGVADNRRQLRRAGPHMNPHLNDILARERQRELVAAAHRGRTLSSSREPFREPIVVRIATARDRSSLEALAALESTEMPGGAALIGEMHKRPVVVLSLSDRTVIADPFVATSDIVALLRLRARQLDRAPRSRLSPRLLRRWDS